MACLFTKNSWFIRLEYGIRLVLVGLGMAWAVPVFSQHYLEIGLTPCATNYSGDLSDSHITLGQTSGGVGVFGRYHLNKFLLVRGQFFAGHLRGDDKNSDQNASRQFRFSTGVLEGSVFLEGVLSTLVVDAISSNRSYYFFPYLFGGVAVAHTSPSVTYYGPENLRAYFVRTPIPEDGKKSHIRLMTPIGLGVRMIVTERFSAGLEGCVRPYKNDLLDGVSQNGNPEENDWYYTLGATFSYFINGGWSPQRRGF